MTNETINYINLKKKLNKRTNVLLSKIYNEEVDGMFDRYQHFGRKRDRSLVREQILDVVKEKCNSRDLNIWMFKMEEPYYVIFCIVDRTKGKYKALKEIGFVECDIA